MQDFKVLLEQLPVGVVLIDGNEKILYSNKEASNILGYDNSEIDYLEQWFEEVFEDKESIKLVKSNYKNAVENNVKKLSYEIETKDGKVKFIEFKHKKLEEQKILISFSDISQRIKDKKRIEYLSYHDELTGLYNRRYLNSQINRLNQSRRYPISVISADLDGLKYVNDNLGHKIGDKYIKLAAEVFNNCLRKEDILARDGGDEFILLLPDTNEENAEKICNRIKKEVIKTNLNYELEKELSITLGHATASNNSDEIDKTIVEADLNMLENKGYKKYDLMNAR